MTKVNFHLTALVALLSPLYALESAFYYGRFGFNIDPSFPQSWIMVLGLTGAGKSSFIWESVGGVDTPNLGKVCHGLEPCTEGVIISPWRHKGIALFLVDTPGFDDTHREDEEILSDIAEDLAGLYKSGITIGAVIYLHRISDIRLQRGALRSIAVLREVIGRDKFPSLILATTFWDAVDQKRGEEREAELTKQGNYWGSMIKAGAKVMRHDDGFQSAGNILNEAISRATTHPLKIQAEMITQKLSVKDTSAMLALESFEFLEKLQNDYAKRLITISEYALAVKEWIERKNADKSSFWDKHGSDLMGIFMTVAQTALVGFTGGVEGIVIGAITEAALRYFGEKPQSGPVVYEEQFEFSAEHFEL